MLRFLIALRWRVAGEVEVGSGLRHDMGALYGLRCPRSIRASRADEHLHFDTPQLRPILRENYEHSA